MRTAILYGLAGIFIGPMIFFLKPRMYDTGVGGDGVPLLVGSAVFGAVVVGFAGYTRERRRRLNLPPARLFRR
jgi:hypothetical protein